MSSHEQGKAAQPPAAAPAQGQQNAETKAAAIDLTDPKVLMGILAQMFQSQSATAQSMAESNAINKRLLEIKEREEEARLAKDAEALARWERARKDALNELSRKKANDEAAWARCSHEDQMGGSTIWPISGFPDGQLHGTCSQCRIPIDPAHYEFDAAGKRMLVPEHPLYKKVLQRDQQLYSSFLPVMAY